MGQAKGLTTQREVKANRTMSHVVVYISSARSRPGASADEPCRNDQASERAKALAAVPLVVAAHWPAAIQLVVSVARAAEFRIANARIGALDRRKPIARLVNLRCDDIIGGRCGRGCAVRNAVWAISSATRGQLDLVAQPGHARLLTIAGSAVSGRTDEVPRRRCFVLHPPAQRVVIGPGVGLNPDRAEGLHRWDRLAPWECIRGSAGP